MRRVLLTIILGAALSTAAWAQESADDADTPEAADAPAESADDSDLDDENYADTEDDDFRPSEEIPADQSIPFPTDI